MDDNLKGHIAFLWKFAAMADVAGLGFFSATP